VLLADTAYSVWRNRSTGFSGRERIRAVDRYGFGYFIQTHKNDRQNKEVVRVKAGSVSAMVTGIIVA
jgi:nuclear transport factor 2 (NTF2) superfamily protein